VFYFDELCYNNNNNNNCLVAQDKPGELVQEKKTDNADNY